jgi:hypothetical protein
MTEHERQQHNEQIPMGGRWASEWDDRMSDEGQRDPWDSDN